MATLAGVPPCCSLHQASWVGSYCVVPCIRCLMGSLSIVQLPMLTGGEREAMVMAPPPLHDSAVLSCFCDFLAFLHRHFSPQSPPSHLLGQSPSSQQQPLPWDCGRNPRAIPKLQLLAISLSRWPASLSGVNRAVARIVWFSFDLGCQRSASSLSASNVSSLTKAIASMWGPDPCFSSPTHWGQVQSY